MKTKHPASRREVDKFKSKARDVVRHHFGKAARRVVHRTGGLTNFVFAVSHAEGKFVVRISPDPARIDSFIKEQWAQKAAREAGVPVPEILEVGLEEIGFPYMISTTVEGTGAVHHPKRFEIVREMGRYAAVINSIRTTGFGGTFDWSENQLSKNRTFREYLEKEFCYEQKIEVLKKQRMVDAALQRKLRATMKAAARTVRSRPVLCHGDLRLKNLIVDADGKINAILDWEKSTSNVGPHWELSFTLHDLGIDAKQHFIEGYGIQNRKLSDAMPLIKAFNILSYAPEVDGAAEKKDKLALERIRLRMAGAFDLYSL